MHTKSSCTFAYKFKYYIINNLGTHKESRSTLKFEKLFTKYLKILAVMILSQHWASQVFSELHIYSRFKIAAFPAICHEGHAFVFSLIHHKLNLFRIK